MTSQPYLCHAVSLCQIQTNTFCPVSFFICDKWLGTSASSPLPLLLQRTPFLITILLHCEHEESMWPIFWGEQTQKLGHFKSQVPTTGWDTDEAPQCGRKGVKKKKLQVFLAQPHILPCLSPPDFTCSWIMMCHPLHISHGDSGSICAALSKVPEEYLT